MGVGNLQKLGDNVATITRQAYNSVVDALQGHIVPRGLNGAPSNGKHDLGSLNNRFRDLYLSGRVISSGQSAASGFIRIPVRSFYKGTPKQVVKLTTGTYGTTAPAANTAPDFTDNFNAADIDILALKVTTTRRVNYRYNTRDNTLISQTDTTNVQVDSEAGSYYTDPSIRLVAIGARSKGDGSQSIITREYVYTQTSNSEAQRNFSARSTIASEPTPNDRWVYAYVREASVVNNGAGRYAKYDFNRAGLPVNEGEFYGFSDPQVVSVANGMVTVSGSSSNPTILQFPSGLVEITSDITAPIPAIPDGEIQSIFVTPQQQILIVSQRTDNGEAVNSANYERKVGGGSIEFVQRSTDYPPSPANGEVVLAIFNNRWEQYSSADQEWHALDACLMATRYMENMQEQMQHTVSYEAVKAINEHGFVYNPVRVGGDSEYRQLVFPANSVNLTVTYTGDGAPIGANGFEDVS